MSVRRRFLLLPILIAVSLSVHAGIEPLRKALKDSDPAVRRDALAGLDLIEDLPDDVVRDVAVLLGDSDPTVRFAAVTAMQDGEACTDEFIASLARVIGDATRNVRYAALDALRDCSYRAWPATRQAIAALDDPDWTVRTYAVEVVAAIGPPAIDALPRLTAMMESGDPYLRETGIRIIGELLRWDEDAPAELRATHVVPAATRSEIVQTLLSGLRDTSVDARVDSASLLAQLSEDWVNDPKAVQEVLSLVEDSDAQVRSNAVALYAKVAQSENSAAAEAAYDRIARLLADPDHTVRFAAAEAASSATSPEVVVEALAAALDDSSAAVRKRAIDSLATLRADVAVEANAAIAAKLQDQSRSVRSAAAVALKTVGDPLEDHTLKALASALADSDAEVRREAAGALGALIEKRQVQLLAFGEAVTDDEVIAAVLVSLAKLTSDIDHETREAAVLAADSAAPFARFPEAMIREALKDGAWEVQAAALRLLTSYEQAGTSLREQATSILRDHPVTSVRTAAATALTNLGHDAPSIAALAEASADDDSELRTAAMRALVPAGKDAESAVPKIIEGLGKQGGDSTAAAAVLAAIGPAAVRRLQEVEEHTAPEDRPPGIRGWFFTSKKDRYRQTVERAQKALVPQTYRALNAKGEAVTLTVTENDPLFAGATWCRYSAQWKAALETPALKPHYSKHPLRLIVMNEWKAVEKFLDEAIEAGQIPASERQARLDAFKARAGGSSLFDPSFIDTPIFEVYYPAPGSPLPESFPSVFDVESSTFGGGLDGAFDALRAPSKNVAIARKVAEAGGSFAGDESEE